MKLLPIITYLTIPLASAYWSSNLNYLSPSSHHPSLGISINRVAKRSNSGTSYDPAVLKFTHGVASGDPTATSVILWTRLSPITDAADNNGGSIGLEPLYWHGPKLTSTAPICAEWKVAKDSGMRNVVSRGKAYTSSDIDFTVKVEAKGLQPFTRYYYQFNICNSDVKSPLGRTKTAPEENDRVSRVRFAVYSCAFFTFGYFNAYGQSVRKDSVDYVLHLGDYIYEYGNSARGPQIGRKFKPDHEIFTLYEYRERYATYRTDEDLLLSHQNYPWISTWDDHEVADNTWRDGYSKLNNTENSFIIDDPVSFDQRKTNAVRAYFEWMPLRQVDMDDNLRIWRSTSFGKLVDLTVLDTRQYDRSITDVNYIHDYISSIANEVSRSQMGPRQEAWFFNQLSDSHKRGATWRLVGSQTMFSYTNLSSPFSDIEGGFFSDLALDTWQGYIASRNRTLHHLYSNNIGNNIFLAGDIHSNWVSDLVWLNSTNPNPDPATHPDYDPKTGKGSIGVEFVGTAVTSQGSVGWNGTLERGQKLADWSIKTNPSVQWVERYYRGYFELDFSHEVLKATYFGMKDISTRNSEEVELARFEVFNGENKVHRPVAGGKVAAGAIKPQL
ncbi:hypothetical protein H072_4661 [Dactylellina haptotyla CBS 200.50]|uniref:PhoD-like phosphatase metallophosphatase domain-containing protein n=1 Tax=Dactylellina haptotyla (strain CBS 200.50) TaxID=1284197 RepID=S8C1I4_DACHA|nr:hypothetical protein H072_4661 [Dactylellina haptotyla CBS 200.50]